MARRSTRVAAGVLVVSGVVLAAIGADAFARSEMERVAREEVAVSLEIDDPSRVDAEIVGGSAIVQLLLGSVDEVTVTVAGIDVGGAGGTFHAEIYDLPTNPVQPIPRVYAYVELDRAAVQRLSDESIDGPPATVTLQPPLLRVATELELDGRRSPVQLEAELVPREALILMRPVSATIGSRTYDAETFQERYGVPLSSTIGPRRFCVDRAFPSTVEVTDVRVSSGAVIVVFGVEQRSVSELQASHGTCDAG